jgi:hypothetical protein
MRINTISKIAAVAALSTVAIAAPAAATEVVGNANEHAVSCTLANGSEYASIGAMMQHLRDRDDNLSGTPKDIADKWFDGNVKILIDKKCEIKQV